MLSGSGFWSAADRLNPNAPPTMDNRDNDPWSRPQVETITDELYQAAFDHKKPDFGAIAQKITAETQARRPLEPRGGGGPGCGLPHSIGRRSSRGGASAPARVLARQPLRQRELREHNNYVRPRE